MIGFLNCKFLVVHNYKGTKKKKISFSKEALFEKGREHEKNYLNKVLKKKYKNVVEIKGGSEEEKLKKTIKAILEYTGPIEAPIKKGDILGLLKVYESDELKKQIDIISAEDIEKSNIFSRIFRSLNYLVWGDV